jgi:hypothetical protein
MSISGSADWVELAKRASDGLEVVLLWSRSRDRVKVAVADERLCHHLDLDVVRADALSVFCDPFAHAAAHLANAGSHDDVRARAETDEDRALREAYGTLEPVAARSTGTDGVRTSRAA